MPRQICCPDPAIPDGTGYSENGPVDCEIGSGKKLLDDLLK